MMIIITINSNYDNNNNNNNNDFNNNNSNYYHYKKCRIIKKIFMKYDEKKIESALLVEIIALTFISIGRLNMAELIKSSFSEL